MTPMDKAASAYVEVTGEVMDGHERQGMEAACLAYVRALSEDQATVEKVARELCFQSIGGKEFGADRDVRTDPFINGNWKRHEVSARAALTALASRDERK